MVLVCSVPGRRTRRSGLAVGRAPYRFKQSSSLRGAAVVVVCQQRGQCCHVLERVLPSRLRLLREDMPNRRERRRQSLAGVGSDDLVGGNLLPRKWSLLSGGHLNHKGKERKMWQPDGGGGGCSSRTWCTHKHKRPRGGHRRFCRKTNALLADWPRRSRKIRQSSFSSPKTKFAPSPVRESLSLFSPICTTVCV